MMMRLLLRDLVLPGKFSTVLHNGFLTILAFLHSLFIYYYCCCCRCMFKHFISVTRSVASASTYHFRSNQKSCLCLRLFFFNSSTSLLELDSLAMWWTKLQQETMIALERSTSFWQICMMPFACSICETTSCAGSLMVLSHCSSLPNIHY